MPFVGRIEFAHCRVEFVLAKVFSFHIFVAYKFSSQLGCCLLVTFKRDHLLVILTLFFLAFINTVY